MLLLMTKQKTTSSPPGISIIIQVYALDGLECEERIFFQSETSPLLLPQDCTVSNHSAVQYGM